MLGQLLKSNDNTDMPMFDVQPGAKPYELTAQVVAAMAYPAVEDSEKRATATAHLRAGYVRWLHAQIGESARDFARLDDALIDPHDAAKTRRKLETILRKRLLAADMAIYFLKAAEMDPPPTTWPKVGKLTIENVSAIVGERERIDPREVRRIFSAAYPVLHFVSAWACRISEQRRLTGDAPDVYALMHTPAEIIAILEQAKAFEALIDRSPSLSAAQAALIRFSPRQG